MAERDADRSPTIDGQPSSVPAAIEAAARLLRDARRPLVYLLDQAPNEAYRIAVGIADRLGAVIDSATSSAHGSSILAFQTTGKVTATFGETRHRADLVVFWGDHVTADCPCYVDRVVNAPGMFVPRGRADRYCVEVGSSDGVNSLHADLHLPLRANADLEALMTIRALLRGISVDAEQLERETSVPLAAWQTLAERMKQARYGLIVSGRSLTATRGAAASAEQLFRLVAELNDHTRFVCQSLGAGGNLCGADNVLAWQTGFPFAVDLARGFPRYSPGEYAAEQLLARGEVDAALVVGGDPAEWLSEPAQAQLQTIPRVTIGSAMSAASVASRQSPSSGSSSHVAIPTATLALHSAGTIVRGDDIALRARAVLDSPLPSEVAVLRQLAAAIDAAAR
jgi:formylmethanofuran dehydrogenase subunit B